MIDVHIPTITITERTSTTFKQYRQNRDFAFIKMASVAAARRAKEQLDGTPVHKQEMEVVLGHERQARAVSPIPPAKAQYHQGSDLGLTGLLPPPASEEEAFLQCGVDRNGVMTPQLVPLHARRPSTMQNISFHQTQPLPARDLTADGGPHRPVTTSAVAGKEAPPYSPAPLPPVSDDVPEVHQHTLLLNPNTITYQVLNDAVDFRHMRKASTSPILQGSLEPQIHVDGNATGWSTDAGSPQRSAKRSPELGSTSANLHAFSDVDVIQGTIEG